MGVNGAAERTVTDVWKRRRAHADRVPTSTANESRGVVLDRPILQFAGFGGVPRGGEAVLLMATLLHVHQGETNPSDSERPSRKA
ncbi:Fc.00g003660.m01.CDS01 [Cosmosporella sp. VM-42]